MIKILFNCEIEIIVVRVWNLKKKKMKNGFLRCHRPKSESRDIDKVFGTLGALAQYGNATPQKCDPIIHRPLFSCDAPPTAITYFAFFFSINQDFLYLFLQWFRGKLILFGLNVICQSLYQTIVIRPFLFLFWFTFFLGQTILVYLLWCNLFLLII